MKEALRRAIAIRDGINRKTGYPDTSITDGVNHLLTDDRRVFTPQLQIIPNQDDCEVNFDPFPIEFVEWLQPTGGAYFNTGVLTSNDIAFEITFSATDTDKFVLGARYDSNNDGFGINTAPRPYVMYGGASVQIDTDVHMNDGNWHTVYLSDSDFQVDGISYNITRGTATRFYNVFIGGMNQNGSIENRKFTGKLKNCKIWKDGILLKQYCPAINKYTSWGYYYDELTGGTLSNAGSGSFTPGPIISGG